MYLPEVFRIYVSDVYRDQETVVFHSASYTLDLGKSLSKQIEEYHKIIKFKNKKSSLVNNV